MSSLLCDSRKGFGVSYSIQIVYQDKDEEYSSRRAGTVYTVIYIEKVSRYLERKHYGRFEE